MRAGNKGPLDLPHKHLSEKLDKSDAPRKSSPVVSSKLGHAGRVTPTFDSSWSRLRAAQARPPTRLSEEKASVLPRKSSYSDIYTDPGNRSASPKAKPSDTANESALSINKTLTDRLRALGAHYDVKDRFLIFQDTFATVVSMETTFSLILRRIKNGYEEIIAQFLRTDYDRELSRAGKQVQEMQLLLERQQQEKEKLLNTIEELKKDTGRLKAKGKEYREKIKSLEDKLKDALETVRRDHYCEARDLQEEISLLKAREKAFIAALRNAKQERLSVDDLLQSFTRHRKSQSTFIPVTRASVPKLNLPLTPSQPFGLLSPIRKDEDRSDHETRESLASFCKDFDAIPNSHF